MAEIWRLAVADEDDEDLEAGVSGTSPPSHMGRRRPTYRNLYPMAPPARFFCETRAGAEAGHFLDECFLCKRHLGGNRDIFMYRGNTPFCSEECREEQMEMDEIKERSRSKFSMKASSRKEQKKAKAAAAAQGCHVRATGTVAAA